VKAKNSTDGRYYYIAKEALQALSMQMPLSVEKEISAEELMKKGATHPLDGSELPIFPARFVDPKTGTGIVMSVPAHAAAGLFGASRCRLGCKDCAQAGAAPGRVRQLPCKRK